MTEIHKEHIGRPDARRSGKRRNTRLSAPERRAQLIDAATTVFSKKGFSGSTTKEIAAGAEINEATIFRHFESKEALYDAVVAERFKGLTNTPLYRQMTDAALRKNDSAVFLAAANVIFHRYRSARDVLRLLIFGILEHRHNVVECFEHELRPLREFLVKYIVDRSEDGAMSAENADTMVFGFVGMVTHHATVGELVGRGGNIPDDNAGLLIYTKIIIDSLTR